MLHLERSIFIAYGTEIYSSSIVIDLPLEFHDVEDCGVESTALREACDVLRSMYCKTPQRELRGYDQRR